jgi:hypothetical protein
MSPTFDPVLAVTPLPQRDGRGGRVQHLLNIVVARSFVQHQHDSHAHRHASRKVPLPQARMQLGSPGSGQGKAYGQRHNNMTLLHY